MDHKKRENAVGARSASLRFFASLFVQMVSLATINFVNILYHLLTHKVRAIAGLHPISQVLELHQINHQRVAPGLASGQAISMTVIFVAIIIVMDYHRRD